MTGIRERQSSAVEDPGVGLECLLESGAGKLVIRQVCRSLISMLIVTAQQEFKILASVIARQLYRRSNLLVGGGDCHAQNARSDMAE